MFAERHEKKTTRVLKYIRNENIKQTKVCTMANEPFEKTNKNKKKLLRRYRYDDNDDDVDKRNNN